MTTKNKIQKKAQPHINHGRNRLTAFRIRDTRDNVVMMTLMVLPLIIFQFLTHYVPIFGLSLAFKDFNYADGIFGSPWKTPLWENFRFLTLNVDIYKIVGRTVFFSLLGMFTNTVFPIALALLLNEVRSNRAAKTYQTILTWPSYLSAIVLSYVAYGFLNSRLGILNQVIEAFGGQPIDVYANSKAWAIIIPALSTWCAAGASSLLYYSTILNIDPTYYEAATLDGANRWQMMFKVTLPNLVPVMAISLILSCGSILGSNFGLFFNLPMGSPYITKELMVYDVYVYNALMGTGDVGLSTAAGFVQSVIGCLLTVSANFVVRRISPENSLF